MINMSRHLYLIKNGSVRFQKKKFEHTLANMHKSEKEHVVHYLIRDHFSGAFYAGGNFVIPVDTGGPISPSSMVKERRVYFLRLA